MLSNLPQQPLSPCILLSVLYSFDLYFIPISWIPFHFSCRGGDCDQNMLFIVWESEILLGYVEYCTYKELKDNVLEVGLKFVCFPWIYSIQGRLVNSVECHLSLARLSFLVLQVLIGKMLLQSIFSIWLVDHVPFSHSGC